MPGVRNVLPLEVGNATSTSILIKIYDEESDATVQLVTGQTENETTEHALTCLLMG